MKATLDPKSMSGMFTRLNAIRGKTKLVPTFELAKLGISGAGVELEVTNGSTWGWVCSPATVDGEGAVLVDPTGLQAVASKGGEGEMRLENGDGSQMIEVSLNGVTMSIPVLPTNDWMDCPEMKSLGQVHAPAAALLGALELVKWCAMKRADHRVGFQCVRLLSHDGRLMAEATDGFSFGRSITSIDTDGQEVKFTIPIDGIPHVERTLKAMKDETVVLEWDDENTVRLSTSDGGLAFRSRNEFPNLQNVIDGIGEQTLRVKVDREALRKSASAVMKILSRSMDGMRVRTTVDEQGLSIESISSDKGTYKEVLEVEVEANPRKGIESIMNPRTLYDLANTLHGEQLELAFAEGMTPVTVQSEANNGLWGFLPMREV